MYDGLSKRGTVCSLPVPGGNQAFSQNSRSGRPNWHYRACLNEQFMRQHMKNKTIFFKKWLSSGCLEAHLAKTSDGMHTSLLQITLYCPSFYEGCLVGKGTTL